MATETRNSEWDAWAARELAAYPEQRAAALDAAVKALDQGLSPRAAVAAARLEAGAPFPPSEVAELWDEVRTLELVARELAGAKPSGELTEGAVRELVARYEARLEATTKVYSAARAAGAASAPSAAPSMSPVPAGRPGPSLQEFLADHSILIISIAGAVLLMVSTLLFEIYGAAGFGSEVQFGGVLALNLVFGVAGYVCFGRPRLRVVGQTYVAIFALLAPLTVAAAWVFLDLSSRGITVAEAVGYGGLGCSALYAILGARLASRGYAALSLLALAVGFAGVITATANPAWTAPWFSLVVFAYVLIANPPAGAPKAMRPFTRVAEPYVHAAAAVALAWSAGEALSEQFGYPSHPTFQLAATLGIVTVAYAGHAWRSHRSWLLGFVWVGASLAILATVAPFGWSSTGYVVDLVLLAWAWAIGSRFMAGRGIRGFVRVGAAVLSAVPALLSASPDGLQAASLLAASGVGLLFALEGRQPLWLLLTVGVFTVDWFWIVKAIVPPPPNASADTLITAYSPLPILYALVGLAHRFTRQARWAWPAYAGAAVVAVGVAAGASNSGDFALAGRALAAYAALAYVIAAVERWWPVMAGSFVAAALSAQLLLVSASAATYWYPLVAAGLAWVFYATGRFWGTSQLARTHRLSGLGLAGTAALFCFGVPDFWAAGSTGAVASLVALGGAAAMVFLDGRLDRRPQFDYVAPAIASVAGFWIASYLGARNVQAYVASTGVTLIVLGLAAAYDRRRPAPLNVCRAAVAAGGALLLGTTAYQSVAEDAAGFYTILWVVESVAALLIGIATRSRTLVLVGAAGLASGSLRAIFLILESVQVYVVFGAIAILLLVGAGVLAALRDRMSAARSAVRSSWGEWT